MNRLCKHLARIFLVAAMPFAHAATIPVTRNDDPAPNGCLPSDCSLREAIAAANANPDADLIQVPAGQYGLPRGRLEINANVQIYGSSDALSNIEGAGEQPVFVVNGTSAVKLVNLSIHANGAHAIDTGRNSDLILEFVTVPESDSQIWADRDLNGTGTLEIRASEIRAYVDCGLVAFCLISDSRILRLQVGTGDDALTRVEIRRSDFDGNLAAAGSGVIIQTSGEVLIEDTTIQNGEIGLLFAAALPAQVTLDRLRFLNNAAPVRMGVASSVTVLDSEFRSNLSNVFDGGPGAILATGDSTWVISGSSFINNRGDGDVGGAVLVEGGAQMSVVNSTFSGNTFTVAAAGAGARGAAIGYRSDAGTTLLSLRHVTVAAPAALPVGVQGSALGGTGGESGLVINVTNSILRGSCQLDANAMDINLSNIQSSGDSCDFDTADNMVNVSSGSLALGTLADHGGPTDTYLPAASSVAVDNALMNLCDATDQRGYPRPFGAGCDIGATEVGADFIFANGFE